jgi:hypothetical protein
LYLDNYGSFPSSSHYTDQFFPTEHVDAHIRGFISAQLAASIADTYRKRKPKEGELSWEMTWVGGENGSKRAKIPFYKPVKNNWLNAELTMPTSDSMMRLWRKKF